MYLSLHLLLSICFPLLSVAVPLPSGTPGYYFPDARGSPTPTPTPYGGNSGTPYGGDSATPYNGENMYARDLPSSGQGSVNALPQPTSLYTVSDQTGSYTLPEPTSNRVILDGPVVYALTDQIITTTVSDEFTTYVTTVLVPSVTATPLDQPSIYAFSEPTSIPVLSEPVTDDVLDTQAIGVVVRSPQPKTGDRDSPGRPRKTDEQFQGDSFVRRQEDDNDISIGSLQLRRASNTTGPDMPPDSAINLANGDVSPWPVGSGSISRRYDSDGEGQGSPSSAERNVPGAGFPYDGEIGARSDMGPITRRQAIDDGPIIMRSPRFRADQPIYIRPGALVTDADVPMPAPFGGDSISRRSDNGYQNTDGGRSMSDLLPGFGDGFPLPGMNAVQGGIVGGNDNSRNQRRSSGGSNGYIVDTPPQLGPQPLPQGGNQPVNQPIDQGGNQYLDQGSDQPIDQPVPQWWWAQRRDSGGSNGYDSDASILPTGSQPIVPQPSAQSQEGRTYRRDSGGSNSYGSDTTILQTGSQPIPHILSEPVPQPIPQPQGWRTYRRHSDGSNGYGSDTAVSQSDNQPISWSQPQPVPQPSAYSQGWRTYRRDSDGSNDYGSDTAVSQPDNQPIPQPQPYPVLRPGRQSSANSPGWRTYRRDSGRSSGSTDTWPQVGPQPIPQPVPQPLPHPVLQPIIDVPSARNYRRFDSDTMSSGDSDTAAQPRPHPVPQALPIHWYNSDGPYKRSTSSGTDGISGFTAASQPQWWWNTDGYSPSTGADLPSH